MSPRPNEQGADGNRHEIILNSDAGPGDDAVYRNDQKRRVGKDEYPEAAMPERNQYECEYLKGYRYRRDNRCPCGGDLAGGKEHPHVGYRDHYAQQDDDIRRH